MYYLLAVIAVLLIILFYVLEREGLTMLSVICLCGTIIVGCENSDWKKGVDKEQAEQDRKAATPHIIREADGCKVYAFKTDREHYFTRCAATATAAATVTTETNYTVACGKNCRREESDVIVTEGK